MDAIAPRPSRRNDSDLYHSCRKPKCRRKLPAPTDNPRRAFCTRFCFDSFYRSRCVVDEAPFKRKNEQQKTCIRRECKLELRRFPLAYAWQETPKTASPPSDVGRPSETPDFSASERPLKPTYGCLGHWSWTPEVDCELELRCQDTLLARLEHNRGRYRLTHPRTFPIMSWASLEQAQRGADETIAPQALPDPFASKHEHENEKPNPLGAPLNLDVLGGDHRLLTAGDKIRESQTPGDPGPIPEFLRRTA
jgi:hypothetical protein